MELIAGYLFIFSVLSLITCGVAILQKEEKLVYITSIATLIGWVAFILFYVNIP